MVAKFGGVFRGNDRIKETPDVKPQHPDVPITPNVTPETPAGAPVQPAPDQTQYRPEQPKNPTIENTRPKDEQVRPEQDFARQSGMFGQSGRPAGIEESNPFASFISRPKGNASFGPFASLVSNPVSSGYAPDGTNNAFKPSMGESVAPAPQPKPDVETTPVEVDEDTNSVHVPASTPVDAAVAKQAQEVQEVQKKQDDIADREIMKPAEPVIQNSIEDRINVGGGMPYSFLPMDLSSNPNERKAVEEQVKKRVADTLTVAPTGNNISGYLNCSRDSRVGIREVSVGSYFILAAIRQPGNQLLERVNRTATEKLNHIKPTDGNVVIRNDFTIDMFVDDDAINSQDMQDLISTINNIDMYVAMSKSPVSEPASEQRRILRAHVGDSVRIHPLAAKSFTADFDGDQATIHFNWESIKNARDALDYLFGNVDRKYLIDEDFFPMFSWASKNKDKIVELFKGIAPANISEESIDALADAYIGWCSGEVAFDELIAEFGKITYVTKDGNLANAKPWYQAKVFDAFVQAAAEAKRVTIIDYENSIVNETHFIETNSHVSKPQAYINWVMHLSERGIQPPNWGEFCNSMDYYFGDIEGKNVGFRLIAGVAKQAKRSEVTEFGTMPEVEVGPSGELKENEYIVYPGDRKALRDLYDNLMSTAQANAMAARAYTGDGDTFTREYFKSAVLKTLRDDFVAVTKAEPINGMFPTPSDYHAARDFYFAFAKAYNYHESIRRIASAEFSYGDRVIDEGTDRSLKLSAKNCYFDEAFMTAYLEIYGDYSMDFGFKDSGITMYRRMDLLTNVGNTSVDTARGDVFWDVSNRGNVTHRKLILNQRYKNMSQTEFAFKNRFYFHGAASTLDNELKKINEKLTKEEKKERTSPNVVNLLNSRYDDQSNWIPVFIMALANSRTGAANNYNNEVEETLTYLGDIMSISEDGHISAKVFNAFYTVNPAMFDSLGISRLELFEQSVWGKRFLELAASHGFKGSEPALKDREKRIYVSTLLQPTEDDRSRNQVRINGLKGLYYSMVASYRTQTLVEIEDQISEAETPEEVAHYKQRLNNVEDVLSSCSDIWNALVSDHIKGGQLYRDVVFREKGDNLYIYGASHWGIYLKDKKNEKYANTKIRMMQQKPGGRYGEQEMVTVHRTALEMLADPNVAGNVKEIILTDMAALSTHDVNISESHTVYQLDMGPNATHSGSNSIKYAARPLNKWEEQQNVLKKEAINMWRYGVREQEEHANPFKNDRQINQVLEIVHSCPDMLFQYDDQIYYDSIAANADPTYHAAEKSTQEAHVNIFYDSHTWQNNGGIQSDVYRGQDKILIQVSIQDVTANDFVKAFIGMHEFYAYDAFGNKVKMSRKTILGKSDPTREDEIAWIKMNPQCAEFFVMQQAHPVSGTKEDAKKDRGRGEIDIVRFSAEDTIKNLPKVGTEEHVRAKIKMILRDDPRFAAMISLCTASKGKSGRVLRQNYRDVEENLINLVMYAAVRPGDFRNSFVNSEFKTMLDEATKESRLGNLGKKLPKDGTTEYIKSLFSTEIYKNFIDMSHSVSHLNDEFLKASGPAVLLDVFEELSCDTASAYLYNHNKQTFTGCKTNRSTPIEGYETTKTFALMPWAASRIDSLKVEEVVDENGKTVEQIVPNDEPPINVEELRKKNQAIPPSKLASIARWLIIKRSKGSEEFNLKAKKAGDDGTFSIIKTPKFLSDEEKSIWNETFDPNNGSFFKAINEGNASGKTPDEIRNDLVLILAKYLQQNDVLVAKRVLADSQEYTVVTHEARYAGAGLTLSDYANVANELLIAYNDKEDGEVAYEVRSASQMAYALKNRLVGRIDMTNETQWLKQIIDESEAILSDTHDHGKLEWKSVAKQIRLPRKQRNINEWNKSYRSLVNQRVSSKERNIRKIHELAAARRANGGNYAAATDTNRNAAHTATKNKANKLKNVTMPKGFEFNTVDKWLDALREEGYVCVGYETANGESYLHNINENPLLPSISHTIVVIRENGTSDEQALEAIARAREIADEHGYSLIVGPPFKFQDVIEQGLGSDYSQTTLLNEGRAYEDTLGYFTPYFDMKLNGGREVRSGYFVASPDQVTTFLEDSLNLDFLGDAAAAATNTGLGKINVNQRGEWSDSLTGLFAHTIETARRDASFTYSICNEEDIEDIENWLSDDSTGWSDRFSWIDHRIDPSNREYDALCEKFDIQVAEFFTNPRETITGEEHIIKTNPGPDKIIGWVKCEIKGYDDDGGPRVAYAPIIPFANLGDLNSKAPAEFEIEDIRISETGDIVIAYKNTADMTYRTVKVVEGNYGANKQTIDGDPIDDIELGDHSFVDFVVAAASTKSRLLGPQSRMETLFTMLLTARFYPHGYNVTDIPGFTEKFSDLKNGPVSEQMFENLPGDFEWIAGDKELNLFINHQVKRCLEIGINPSYFLCSGFYDGAELKNHNIVFQYQMLFQQDAWYQNGLMNFINRMQPNICPPSLDVAESMRNRFGEIPGRNKYLFFPSLDRQEDFAYGTMRMLIPRSKTDEGKTVYTDEIVRKSFGFFSEDNSALKKVSINQANFFVQEIQMAMQSGVVPDNKLMKEMVKLMFSAEIPAGFWHFRFDDAKTNK